MRIATAIRLGLLAGVSATAIGPLRAQGFENLGLHEVPGAGPRGNTLALLISGDGGWAAIDKDIARTLSDSGISVVGLNAKSYLGTRRTPDEFAATVDRILRHYLEAWGRERIILVGYSRGAVVAPFIVTRLPADLRARIDLVAMLGLGLHAGFHVTLFDLLGTTTNPKDPPVEPEIRQLADAKVPMLCIYGLDERESFCRDAPEGWMTKIARRGAHHFDGNHAALVGDILTQLKRPL